MFVCLVKNVHDEGLWFLNVKLFWVPEGAHPPEKTWAIRIPFLKTRGSENK